MSKAIAINPSNAPALNYLGYSYAEEGTHLDEAEKLIKRALVIEPEDGFYVDSLGWVYYQKGEYQKAVDQLERAVNLTGSDPTITEHLGDAYNKVGKERDARHQYEDALKRTQDADQIRASQGQDCRPSCERTARPALSDTAARRATCADRSRWRACAPSVVSALRDRARGPTFRWRRLTIYRLFWPTATTWCDSMQTRGGDGIHRRRTAFQGAREYHRAQRPRACGSR